MQLILHTPFGARINRAWGLALRKKFCRSFNFELQAAATDNGICLSLSRAARLSARDRVRVREVGERRAHAHPGAAGRADVRRALALERDARAGDPAVAAAARKSRRSCMRMRADDLLAACFPDAAACAENLTGPIRIPDHVLVRETIDNCLHEAMDLDGLIACCAASKRARSARSRSTRPSPRRSATRSSTPTRTRTSTTRRSRSAARAPSPCGARPRADAGDGAGILDPAAIAEVAESVVAAGARRRRAARRARRRWSCCRRVAEWTAVVRRTRRAAPRDDARRTASCASGRCAERLDVARVAYPDARAAGDRRRSRRQPAARRRAKKRWPKSLRGWLESSGPVTVGGARRAFRRRRATRSRRR